MSKCFASHGLLFCSFVCCLVLVWLTLLLLLQFPDRFLRIKEETSDQPLLLKCKDTQMLGLFADEEKAKRKENGTAQRGSQRLKTNSWVSKIKVAAWPLTLQASDLLP